METFLGRVEAPSGVSLSFFPLRLLPAVVAFFGVLCAAGFGQPASEEVSVKFRLLAWPHPRGAPPETTLSPKTGKPVEVGFLANLYYLEGNQTKRIRLLPAKPSPLLTYAGKPALAFFSNEARKGIPAFTLNLNPSQRNNLYLLYPKTPQARTFNVFPVVRPAGVPNAGVAVNMTRHALTMSVDGRGLKLQPGRPLPFRYSLRGKDFVRIEVQVTEPGSSTPKTVVSVKKFLGPNDNPIFLLRRQTVRGKILLNTF